MNKAEKQRDILSLLSHLVSISSVFPHEQVLSTYLSGYLKDLGFHIDLVYTAQTRPNIVATYGKSETYIGFYGHMDTVPPDTRYIQDPYTIRVKDGYAYGLGVVDMKGGITAILQAASYAVSHEIPIKIVFGVDEEDISQGAHDLVASGLMRDISFLIVAESGQVKDVSDDMSVCLGRKGRVVLDIQVTGKTAHAAESEKGINAIEQAGRLVSFLSQQMYPIHENLGKTSLIVQYIHAESGSFSVPDRCDIRYSLLTTPLVSSKQVIDSIKDVGKRENISLSIGYARRSTPYGESYEIQRDHPFLQKIFSEVFSAYRVHPAYMPSVADENVFANRLGIPVLSIGPIGGGDHTCDEWVDLSSLFHVSEVYTQIVKLWFRSL